MEQHLQFLKTSAHFITKKVNNLTIPSLFEYYSAHFLSKKLGIPFYVWKDLTPTQKNLCNFPNADKGCDIADENFKHLGQSKYYQNSRVNYGKLATFLGFPQFSKKKSSLHLLRSQDSKVSSDIQSIINIGNMKNHTLSEKNFQIFIKQCTKIQIPKLKEQDFVLRQPQIKALELIEKSERNIKIKIATGVGKTKMCLYYIKKNKEDDFLVLLPTIVLLEQWKADAIKNGIEEDSIYIVGTGYNNDLLNFGKHKITLCVYNSYEIVRERKYSKIFIDEAHHIDSPKIYEDDKETNESFISKIKSDIAKSNNIVMLSATLDNSENFDYYSYSIRDAINDGYISDYQIVCPIFNNDPSDENIVKYLIEKGESHCVVYTNTIKKCKEIEYIFNKLLPGCCKSVTSRTRKKARNDIIKEFNDGKIRFLVNVRILSEGFNSPIASSCIFMHMPTSKSFIIQCLGRILRLHEDKKIANLYLPFNTEEDVRKIQTFFKILIENDETLKECFYDKRLGTYINLEKVAMSDNQPFDSYKKIEEVEFRYDLIFNSMGLNFKGKLLLKFIDEFERVPKQNEIFEDIMIGHFYSDLKVGKNKALFQELLKNKILKQDYNKFLENKKQREGLVKITIKEKFGLLSEFVHLNQRAPLTVEMYKDFAIGWFFTQLKQNQHEQLFKEFLLTNEIIRAEYQKFLKYKDKKDLVVLKINEKFSLLSEYVNLKNELPARSEIYKRFAIGNFYYGLKRGNYKVLFQKLLPTNEIIRKDYENYLDNKDKKKDLVSITIKEKFSLLSEFVEFEGKIPLYSQIYKDLKIGIFLSKLRLGMHKKLFKDFMLTNEIIRKDYENYENYIQRKKERKSLIIQHN